MLVRRSLLGKSGLKPRIVTNRSVESMNSIIYIVGLVVVVLFILSFLGLR